MEVHLASSYTACIKPLSPCCPQVEEWGEAYQALSWGPLIELVKADLQPDARRDKARMPSRELARTSFCKLAKLHSREF